MNIISVSGGKDSTALLCWAKENLPDFQAVFCDTGWESQITLDYLQYLSENLAPIHVIKSKKFENFKDMVIKNGIFPDRIMRFCTTQLKLLPMKDYIKDFNNVHLYIGIRADESQKRAKLPENVFDDDFYKCWIHRPLMQWSASDCFGIMQKHGIKPNPLYKMGMKRVGCFPCIFATKKELRQLFKRFPDVIDAIREMEIATGQTFFNANYIPERFCSIKKVKNNGEIIALPTVDDVAKYLAQGKEQIDFMSEKEDRCMSYYSICE